MSQEKPFPPEDSSWSNIALQRKAESEVDPAIAAAEAKTEADKVAAANQAAADAAELAQLRAEKAAKVVTS